MREKDLQIEYCDFPEDALYDLENNVWVRLQGQKLVILGITSMHAALAGKLVKIQIKPVGTSLRGGQSVATVESVKYFGVVRTPVSGILTERNSTLEKRPKLANDSPYGDGWFVKIESSLLPDEIKSLRDLSGAQQAIRDQISELRVR